MHDYYFKINIHYINLEFILVSIETIHTEVQNHHSPRLQTNTIHFVIFTIFFKPKNNLAI